MRFVFNERKAAQMAAHLLDLAGGKMKYLLLMKLMYLADRTTLLAKGRPISGDRYVSMKLGPVLSEVLNLLRDEPQSFDTPWFEYITPPAEYEVSLKTPNPTLDEISPYERKVIEDVWRSYGRLDPFELAHLTHVICPEWIDPEDSAQPIRPEDILRNGRASEAEIEQIETDAQSIEMVELLREVSPRCHA